MDLAHCVEESVKLLVNASLETQKRTVLLRHDVGYTNIAGIPLPPFCVSIIAGTIYADDIARELREALQSRQMTILYSKMALKMDPLTSVSQSSDIKSTVADNAPVEDCVILYIGGESLGLTNLLVTHASCEVCQSIIQQKLHIAHLVN